jgi:hypothetical protein
LATRESPKHALKTRQPSGQGKLAIKITLVLLTGTIINGIYLLSVSLATCILKDLELYFLIIGL